MTREEAKEAIKEAYGTSEYTDEIIKALSSKPQEWISVKEHGNPTMSDDYWVTIQYPATRIVEKVFFSYDQNKWYYVYSDKILAWQKIEPSPYKGE